jgi:hypothetical protein
MASSCSDIENATGLPDLIPDGFLNVLIGFSQLAVINSYLVVDRHSTGLIFKGIHFDW